MSGLLNIRIATMRRRRIHPNVSTNNEKSALRITREMAMIHNRFNNDYKKYEGLVKYYNSGQWLKRVPRGGNWIEARAKGEAKIRKVENELKKRVSKFRTLQIQLQLWGLLDGPRNSHHLGVSKNTLQAIISSLNNANRARLARARKSALAPLGREVTGRF
jgi:hypothetical protein